jgi:hypothetical protein
MIDEKAISNIIKVFAFIGAGAVIVWFQNFGDWLSRTGYDVYLIYFIFGFGTLVIEIVTIVKYGWKTAILNTIIVISMLTVLFGIFKFTLYVKKETHTFVAVIVGLFLSLGFFAILEKFSKGKNKIEIDHV